MKISLEQVTKRYGGSPALADVSWSGTGGQIVAIIGLNSAGKTTLLRTLAGIVAPSRGVVRYNGEVFGSIRQDR